MPTPRIWFVNEAGTELIQIQQDCFVHNWRKAGISDETYPRYETIRQTFEHELQTFLRFVEREGLGRVVPIQAEIAYVNHIASGAGWATLGEIERVIAPWSDRYSDDFLQQPEQGRFSVRYLIPGRDSQPIGRLHVEFAPALDVKTKSPMFVLTLTARGTVRGAIGEALAFLDLGRSYIVRGFASITTKNMHQVWGRTDVG
jgi:uncharacterized protein (TIGR04255 family)